MKKTLSVLSSFTLACTLVIPATALAAPHQKQKKHSCITLYEHVHFQGRSKTFCSNDKSLVNDGWNDRASSAKISAGDGVTVYEHANYKGHKFTMGHGGYGDLTEWVFSPKNLHNWNDVISSLRIK